MAQRKSGPKKKAAPSVVYEIVHKRRILVGTIEEFEAFIKQDRFKAALGILICALLLILSVLVNL